ncbi:DnaB-like helicase C-terminal domain-containing protein [Moritella viscosa]
MAEKRQNQFQNQFSKDKNRKDSAVDALKVPPHSFEAEQSVLGGLFIDNEAWDRVTEFIVAKDFYSRPHQLIFEAMAKLVDQHIPLDIITVSEWLDNEELLDDAGDIVKNTPSASNITAYANIVRERAVIRELIAVASDISESGYEPQGRKSTDLLDLAESKVFQIAESRQSEGQGPKNLESVLQETVDKIEELYQTPHDGVTGVASGYNDLDAMTTGFQPSDLIIVAARPSMGKTTFAMNLCEHAALNQDKPAVIFSLEMPAEQIMMRMLASLGKINQTKVRTGQLDGLTPTEVRSRSRRIARDHGGISMIMIDYLQLMRVPALSENRTLEIAEISRSLKSLAKELKCPVIALSQLNRSLEQRADKRPVNSDLRESGSIEQDADLIMFIYRDEVYNDDSPDKGTAEIIIGKQRNGPIGKVRLTFNGQFSRFDNFTGPAYDDDY